MSLIKFLHYTTAIGVTVAYLSYWRKYFLAGWLVQIHEETSRDTRKDTKERYFPCLGHAKSGLSVDITALF